MDIIAPTRLPNGAKVWLDGETREFIKRLNELDPRLALVQFLDASWGIFRVGEDGSEHLIAKSQPYAKLDAMVIERLRHGDTWKRGGSRAVEETIEANVRAADRLRDQAADTMAEAVEKALSKAWRGRLPRKGEGIE